MEKLVVFPLNNDTEILIKGLKENKLYQVVAVSSYIEDRSRLELLQKKSSIYCSTEFEECLTRADAIVFSENTMGYSYDGYQKRVQMALDSGKKIYAGLALLDKIQIDRDKVCILQESELSDEVVSPNKKKIDIPVISVMELGENCEKFQSFRRYFRRNQRRRRNLSPRPYQTDSVYCPASADCNRHR